MTEVSAEGDAFYEWLLSDHPDAMAERTRRREANYEAEKQRADQVQAWVSKIDATSDAPEAMRSLADSLGPSAAESRARAEAAIAETDESYVARERDRWETYIQVSAPNGSWDYRYPARYVGYAAASQPQPGIEPEPEATQDEPEISN
jgi:hypothetical protein